MEGGEYIHHENFRKIHKVDTYMELNIPIKAVKQKPMANMDFIRTCKQKGQACCFDYLYTEGLWAHTLKNRLCTVSLESRSK